jgi:hypothetical protein
MFLLKQVLCFCLSKNKLKQKQSEAEPAKTAKKKGALHGFA